MVKVRGRRCVVVGDVTDSGSAATAAAVGSHDDCHGDCSQNWWFSAVKMVLRWLTVWR